MSAVISTVLVLEQLYDELGVEDSLLNVVFDPNLSYESGIKLLRAQENQTDITAKSNEFPLLLFNRSSLRYDENLGKRSQKPAIIDEIEGTHVQFKCVQIEFDVNISYIHSDVKELEAFELDYMLKQKVSSIKELSVNFDNVDPGAGLGSFNYYLDWKDLEDISIEYEGNYFKGINASAVLRGPIFAFTGSGKIIQEINSRIHSFHTSAGDGVQLTSVQIIP